MPAIPTNVVVPERRALLFRFTASLGEKNLPPGRFFSLLGSLPGLSAAIDGGSNQIIPTRQSQKRSTIITTNTAV